MLRGRGTKGDRVRLNNIEVIGLGALNIDHIYKVERILGDGETVEPMPEYEDSELELLDTCPGGSAANTIYGLAKLGVKTGFIGAIGDDAEGKILLRDFQTTGVDTSQIKVKPQAKTGLATCLSDKLNFRSIHVTPGANNLLTMDDLDLGYINQARVLHLSSFADDRQFKVLLELMDKLGPSIKISFSPGALYAAKGLKALAPILDRTYVLFINQNEIRQLTGQDVSLGTESCLKHGCHIVVVTLGKGVSWKTVMANSYIRDSENEYIVEPSNKDIISALDTTGAGDAFATGFLYGRLKGLGLKKCGLLGDIVAQFSITEVGARQGLPTLNELSRRYRELYNKEL